MSVSETRIDVRVTGGVVTSPDGTRLKAADYIKALVQMIEERDAANRVTVDAIRTLLEEADDATDDALIVRRADMRRLAALIGYDQPLGGQ